MNPNHQFYLILRSIRSSTNQVHLDVCRKMIRERLLNRGLPLLANRLANAMQIRELEFLIQSFETAE